MNTSLTNNSTTPFATNGYLPNSPTPAGRPDPQVQERPTRRRFTVAYKVRILKEADACSKPGEVGALLRREGLYSSTLANFRKLRDAGQLAEKNTDKAHKQRQDKEAARQRDARRIAALETENQKLRVLLELQKKVAALLDLTLPQTPSE
jgi:transposase